MLLLSDEVEIIDDVSELEVDDVKVGEEGDRFVEELLLDARIIESSGSMMSFFAFAFAFLYFSQYY